MSSEKTPPPMTGDIDFAASVSIPRNDTSVIIEARKLLWAQLASEGKRPTAVKVMEILIERGANAIMKEFKAKALKNQMEEK